MKFGLIKMKRILIDEWKKENYKEKKEFSCFLLNSNFNKCKNKLRDFIY